MNYRYNEWLSLELIKLQRELELTNYNICVEDERMFISHSIEPNTLYVVIKYLASSIQTGAEVQPVQILIMSEQNGLDAVKVLFNKFATDYNWKVTIEGSEYIKHQYQSPVVLSNFDEAAYGYRAVLYMSGTLYVMKDVIDIKKLEIDDTEYAPISLSISYSMSTNTQQMPDKYIATSVKTASSFSATLSLAMTDSTLVNKVLGIMNETASTGTGNENFKLAITFRNSITITKNMKLISAQVITAVNQVPSLQLGFMR